MLAQTAAGTRHSHPHVAQKLKRAAQTACIQAVARTANAQSTGDCSAAEARLLVDNHRWPRQKSACDSIDGLCEQGTDIEGQFGLTAADALIEKQSACDNHRVWFQVRGSNLR